MKLRATKIATVMLVVVLIMATTILPASAEVYSPSLYLTTSATAGNYKTESTHNLTSQTLGTLCGGDVGIWFYTGNVGLQASFYPSTSRAVYMQCWEEDSAGTDVHAKSYKGGFEVENGVYLQRTAWVTWENGNQIEADSTVELYMKFMIATHSRDTSTSVPAGALRYRFWAY